VHVLLSAAMSADGYIDNAAAAALMLSDEADLDQVDDLRARSDAIMVGAQTLRADDPRLAVKSAARRQERVARGRPANPLKVTMTRSGDLDPDRRFFTEADRPPLVYVGLAASDELRARLSGAAEIVPVPGLDLADLRWVLADLAGRGIGRLMVEGGAQVLEQFLIAGLADEMRLAIAPVFVADPAAPRLRLPLAAGRMHLAGVTQVGRMSVLRYLRERGEVGPSGEGTAADGAGWGDERYEGGF
jgi:riboflavin-specific deaminase-like protein